MFQARFLGFDLSTTALTAAVTDDEGHEAIASVPMEGATLWHNGAAFDPRFLPEMFSSVLGKILMYGWDFSFPGSLCFSVRQHDMVVTNIGGQFLAPLLSWQCNEAVKETQMLKDLRFEGEVGKIEERFILPKALWLLIQEPELQNLVYQITTTGDYIVKKLTRVSMLSTSDALSNGLLNQRTKRLAEFVIEKAGLDPRWFPEPVQSGSTVGEVCEIGSTDPWFWVIDKLKGWTVKAPLGDNHASAVGCGLNDFNTMVISLGSSGTVVRQCGFKASLLGDAACFEYFYDRLLLKMLHECCVWYNRFLINEVKDALHEEYNRQALVSLNWNNPYCFISQEKTGNGWKETYPADWKVVSDPVRVASTQGSIAIYILRLVRDLLCEVKNATEPVNKFVITGGLSQSEFMKKTLAIGLAKLAPKCKIYASDRKGPLANKSAVLGALFTAMAGSQNYLDIGSVINRHCPLKLLEVSKQEKLQAFIAQNL
jgi:sugar (pentulose or hexulose) kinase